MPDLSHSAPEGRALSRAAGQLTLRLITAHPPHNDASCKICILIGELKRNPLCETTSTPRKACSLDCGTYPGNLGPCESWEEGANGRCVYCDHGKECHFKLDNLIKAVSTLLEWLPVCSEGSSGYARIQKVKEELLELKKVK